MAQVCAVAYVLLLDEVARSYTGAQYAAARVAFDQALAAPPAAREEGRYALLRRVHFGEGR